MIDFTQTTREPVPDGVYEAVLTDCVFVEKTSSGNMGVKFSFTLTEEPYDGRKLRPETKSLQPQAIWSTKNWMVALGADPADLSGTMELDTFKEMIAGLIGNECRVQLSVSEYTDRTTGEQRFGNQVDAVLSMNVLV